MVKDIKGPASKDIAQGNKFPLDRQVTFGSGSEFGNDETDSVRSTIMGLRYNNPTSGSSSNVEAGMKKNKAPK